jgi:hypothetical protein
MFISIVLSLAITGLLCCGVWFYLLLKQGMGLGWILFDVAIIIFSIWAIVAGVIPMLKRYDDKRRQREDI